MKKAVKGSVWMVLTPVRGGPPDVFYCQIASDLKIASCFIGLGKWDDMSGF